MLYATTTSDVVVVLQYVTLYICTGACMYSITLHGTFGRVRHTKDVIFDMNVNFRSVDDNDLPSEQEFNNIPTLELIADADNADALGRQLILPPALPIAPTTDTPDPERYVCILQIQTYHYLTRSSLRLPIPTMKSEALTTR